MRSSVKKIFSVFLVIALLAGALPFAGKEIGADDPVEIEELVLDSDVTSVSPGELPPFHIETSTEHVTITPYEASTKNTKWVYREYGHEFGMNQWKVFDYDVTPTAVDDGTTRYGFQIHLNVSDGYTLTKNTRIIFNGTDVTDDEYTEVIVHDWGGYVIVDLGTAGEEIPFYKMSYDPNGGSGSMKATRVLEGEKVKLPSCTFDPPENHVFDHWEVGGTAYNVYDEITMDSDKTAKAIWREVHYIRESRATLSPATLTDALTYEDLSVTSADPSKYTVRLSRVYDKTDKSLNTQYPYSEYPHNVPFVLGHEYSIEISFQEVEPYEYDEVHGADTASTFYLNDNEIEASPGTAFTYSSLRIVYMTAESHLIPLEGTVRIKGSVKRYGDLLELEYTGDIAGIPEEKLSFEWQTSDNKSTWYNVIGETGSTYQTPDTADGVYYVRVRVTAEGYDGYIYSDMRSINPPSETAPIEGKVYAIQDHQSEDHYEIGLPITATAYNSIGNEMTMDGMAYQWQRRLSDKVPYEDIPGATDKTYTPTDEDEQYWIRVEVTCSQLVGELRSNSKWVSWRDVQHTVKFDMHGHGEAIADIQKQRGTYLQRPDDPVEEGWSFIGWYTDETFSKSFDFDEAVTDDLTIHAKWMKNALYIVTAGSLNVRYAPNEDSGRRGGLNYGETVQAEGFSGEWMKIDFDGEEGWVDSNYLALTYSEETAVDPTEYTLTATIQVRDSVNGTRIGGLKSGDTVLVTGKLTDDDGVEWYVIDAEDPYGNHYLGFIKAQFTEGKEVKYDTAKYSLSFPEFPEDISEHSILYSAVIADGNSASITLENIGEDEDGNLLITVYPDDGENFGGLTKDGISIPADCGYEVDSITLNEDGSLTIVLKETAEEKKTFSITFDLNGGTWDGKSGTVVLTIEEGTTIILPKPEKDGYDFDYWEGSRYEAGAEYTVSEDHTLKAIWKEKSSGNNPYVVPNTGVR